MFFDFFLKKEEKLKKRGRALVVDALQYLNSVKGDASLFPAGKVPELHGGKIFRYGQPTEETEYAGPFGLQRFPVELKSKEWSSDRKFEFHLALREGEVDVDPYVYATHTCGSSESQVIEWGGEKHIPCYISFKKGAEPDLFLLEGEKVLIDFVQWVRENPTVERRRALALGLIRELGA